DLQIPVGMVLTSPTYRALETVRYAGLSNALPFEQLGDGGQNMQAVKDAAAAFLRTRVAQMPVRGTNTLIVTHLPNITQAFPDWKPQVADGEAVILRPTGPNGVQVVGRMKIDEWGSAR